MVVFSVCLSPYVGGHPYGLHTFHPIHDGLVVYDGRSGVIKDSRGIYFARNARWLVGVVLSAP